MVNADAKVVLNGVLEQARSAAGVADRDAMLISCVNALILPAGDGDPQVARDGYERDLSLIGAQDGNNHRVRAEGGAGAFVGADQQEVDGLLSVVEDVTAGGVDGWQRRDSINEEVRVDSGFFGLRRRGREWMMEMLNQVWAGKEAMQSLSTKQAGRELELVRRSAPMSPECREAWGLRARWPHIRRAVMPRG